MMEEILKPLLDNEVLTDEVKTAITEGLATAIEEREKAIKVELEESFNSKKEKAKTQLEEALKSIEADHKNKMQKLQESITELKEENANLVADLEELESKPFVNITESDLEKAEEKLTSELEEKYEKAFDIAKEKFNETFEIVENEINTKLEEAVTVIEEQESIIEELKKELSEKDESITELENDNNVELAVKEALTEAEETYSNKISSMKDHLVTATEIMLEQELSELKADYAEIVKEHKGKELLETLKNVVKDYWDVDAEVAEDILEMKKSTETKLEQYKSLLKKEHERLEESENEKEELRKKLLIENKANFLTDDKKEKLEELTESLNSKELEDSFEDLMESVVSSFEDSFKNDIVKSPTQKAEVVINESTIVTGNEENTKVSSNLKSILELAGINK